MSSASAHRQPPGRSRRGLPASAPLVPAPSDKRFRRSDVRQGRRRNWRRLLMRSGWIAGAVVVSLGFLIWVGSIVVNASVLRVTAIDVTGTSRLTAADVQSQLHNLMDTPLLRADLREYQQILLKSPWIASAQLWRVLPSTVKVQITERVPVAIARFAGELFLVDGDGVIVEKFSSQYSRLNLPVIDGLAASASVGDTVDEARIGLFNRLMHDLSARADLVDRLSQIDVSNPRNAIVTLRDEPLKLYLGEQEFLTRLERWIQTAASVRAQLDLKDHVDLRHDSVMFGQ
jgi:cell division septal protein FtsQ